MVRETRKKTKTFTGCWTCRAKKRKCDEAVPVCSQCQDSGDQCAGYGAKLAWVGPDDKHQPSRRRLIRSETTWSDRKILDAATIDRYLAQTDEPSRTASENPEDEFPISPSSPFSVFRSSSASPHPQAGPSRPPPRLPGPPDPLQDSHFAESLGSLPSHFVNHVAQVLMPFEHESNPWQTSIPQAVLKPGTPQLESAEQTSLYNAVLALAATHLIQKDVANKEEMQNKASMHYGIATNELVKSIGTGGRDYGTFLAAVMTMMMVEVFRGNSGSWRTHLHGAWDFIRTQGSTSSWTSDALSMGAMHAWYTSAILCESSILCIEPSSPETNPERKARSEQALLRGMADCVVLGFTLGANPTIMRCITEIQRLKALLQTNAITVEDLEQKSEDIRGRLDEVGSPENGWPLPISGLAERFSEHHIQAFKHAAFIYLARETQDASPYMLSTHVAEVYRNVEAYFASGGENFAVWPAFVAAAEAYDEPQMGAARNWLEKAKQVGMGNRDHLSGVLEEIWRRRSVESMFCGLEPGLITMDWREVMSDLQVDVLLI